MRFGDYLPFYPIKDRCNMDRFKAMFGRLKALLGRIKKSINTQKIKELIEIIKNNKILALKISAVAAVVLICVVSLIVTVSNSYKPDSETLKIVNEAAVIVYDSEIVNTGARAARARRNSRSETEK